MRIVSQSVATANNTLSDMTASMQEIGSSSGKISKIIKVIDEIAFQTNILALNAAVEAARAGEAGAGFAVVADEVRNLAQRSAQAAKDTASLIEESILKSTEGSKKLGQVAASIQGITEGVGRVKTLIDEVEASSKEQAQGIDQISKAVAQMEEVTQRSAASAEQTASASEELNAQSQALMAVVGNLQAMAGTGSGNAHSGLQHTSYTAKRPQSASLVRNSPGLRPATPAGVKPTPALIRATAYNQTEFPLDDAEFKEF
jgi:methyl-accepting chemotaxis protein/methyl-accepting chemotaxis protein-1 (serine sensor receptor)